MDPFFHTGLSISDSLKTVRKSVLIYETIIFYQIKYYKATKRYNSYQHRFMDQIKQTKHSYPPNYQTFILPSQFHMCF